MANIVKTVVAVYEGLIAVEERIADFIQNGPSTGIAGHVRDGYRTRCDQFANLPGWVQALGSRQRGSLGRICEPWLSSRGFDGPTLTPPFTGGQCAVPYTVTVQRTNTLTGEPAPNLVVSRTGPIRFVTPLQPPLDCNPGSVNSYYRLVDGAGNAIIATNVCAPFDLNPIVSVVRNDGQPDNCGDPDPELKPGPNPPPDPGPLPGPEPSNDPDNPDGPPLVPIPDYDDPVGGPTPIEGPEQNPDVVGPDDIPGIPDSAPGSPDAIAPPIAVDPGPGGGGNTTSFGEPPAGRAWVGCFLVFDFPPAFGGISGSEVGNLASPRVFGNASLVYEGGRGIAEKVTSEHWQLFRPSGALGVTGVFVNVDPGFSYTVRPVSIELCPENNCGAAT